MEPKEPSFCLSFPRRNAFSLLLRYAVGRKAHMTRGRRGSTRENGEGSRARTSAAGGTNSSYRTIPPKNCLAKDRALLDRSESFPVGVGGGFRGVVSVQAACTRTKKSALTPFDGTSTALIYCFSHCVASKHTFVPRLLDYTAPVPPWTVFGLLCRWSCYFGWSCHAALLHGLRFWTVSFSELDGHQFTLRQHAEPGPAEWELRQIMAYEFTSQRASALPWLHLIRKGTELLQVFLLIFLHRGIAPGPRASAVIPVSRLQRRWGSFIFPGIGALSRCRRKTSSVAPQPL